MALLHSTNLSGRLQQVPHALRTSINGHTPDPLYYFNIHGCGAQIIATGSPRVPWLLTVFITDLDDLYFETSYSLSSSQARADQMARAKIEGVTLSVMWFMAYHGGAGSLQPTIQAVADQMRQILIEGSDLDQVTSDRLSQCTAHNQLSLF